MTRVDGCLTVPVDADEWRVVTTSTSRDAEKRVQRCAPSSPVSVFNSGKQTEEDTTVILATARVRLQTGVQLHEPCRALCDPGAQISLISSDCARRLKLPVYKCYTLINGIGRASPITKRTKAYIRPWFDSQIAIKADVYIIDELPGVYPTVLIEADIPRGLILADPDFATPAPIQMLIGADVWPRVVGTKLYRHHQGAVIQDSEFGYCVLGRFVLRTASTMYQSIFAVIEEPVKNEEELDKLLRSFWEVETQVDAIKAIRSPQEEMAEKIFIESHYRERDGRYVVEIPLKEDAFPLPDSRGIALRRFFQLERRLLRDPELRAKYIEFMREFEYLGHMQEAVGEPKPGRFNYIPHHCVVGKFRVVLDGSAHEKGGRSFNDEQLVGEKLQYDILDQIMRARRHKIAFVADIEKMFRQVIVDPSQWDLQRLYWREGPDMPLKEYWVTRVIYGMASSLHCAVRTMFQCARDYADKFPMAAKSIEADTYVDDLSAGADSVAEAGLLAKEIDFVLRQGGFTLRHWSSNAKEITQMMSAIGKQTVELHDGDNTNILGLIWLTKTDEFAIRVRADGIENAVTKRQILSCISKLYDPNGYIGPVVLRAKILMQDLWKLGQSSWDKSVPDDVLRKWIEFCDGMRLLVNFRLPRWLGTSAVSKVQLHGFCDASSLAYGACIYVRATDEAGVRSSTLLIAKSRVAPIKMMTIPRLELRAAELLARLMHRAMLVCEFGKAEQFMWSDSTIVLHWLRKSTYDLKTFVANRVQAVQDYSKGIRWAHVDTKDNPADLISRGMDMADFLNSRKWKHGPEWLLQPTDTWPKPKLTVTPADKVEILKEYKRPVANVSLIQVAMECRGKLLIDRFSNWKKIVRITAYVLVFIRNAKLKMPSRRRRQTRAMAAPRLSANDMFDAAIYWVKYVQKITYGAEIASLQTGAKDFPPRSKIAALRPKLVEGVLRVGGRINKSLLEYEERYPIIIPPKSRLCYLIVDQAHRDNMHGGIQLMMQHIRQQFWIPQLRQQLRCFVSRCMRCVRESKKTTDQIMADLPAERVRPARPFTRVGVDMAGPIKIREVEASEIIVKGYVAVFVCQVTRAVHLEAVTSMSAKSFLDAFYRFCARRGTPVYIYSDNGTNFVGAEKELREAVKSWHGDSVKDLMNEKGIIWRFITPAAPHQGGLWEAAVKQMKHHLRRVMGPVKYTFEGLSTLLSGVEACLNSRPLYALSDDPSDCAALTPAHFLNGGPIKLPLPRRTYEQAIVLRGGKLFKTIQAQTDAFWECWSKDYLRTLMLRPKWRKERENIKVGQLVLIESDQFAPTYWSMGRVTETHPGLDGKVRNVTIRLQGGVVRRAVQRLCILPTDHVESECLS